VRIHNTKLEVELGSSNFVFALFQEDVSSRKKKNILANKLDFRDF
jgi:hypothetical protein